VFVWKGSPDEIVPIISDRYSNGRPIPLSYGIVVDNSGSLREKIEDVAKAANGIITANSEKDEVFLIRFTSSEKIRLIQDLTSDKNALKSKVDEFFIEGGQTAMLDALMFAAKHLVASERQGPRVLILITDGGEMSSRTKEESLTGYLRNNQIRVFVFSIFHKLTKSKVTDRLAKSTGGRVFMPKTSKEFERAMRELSAAMRSN
ncbi:MAG: VWA domain-containing protein, partial [Pyrinomonadaceae bacterium]